jgi:hypothetical protein
MWTLSGATSSGTYGTNIRQAEGAGEKFNEVKLLIVGQENVGKTSLLRWFQSKKKKKPNLQVLSTDGIDIEQFEMKNIRFRAWDFAGASLYLPPGQEVYYSTHQFFLSENAIYIVVWDLRYKEENSKVEFWLQSIQARTTLAHVLLVGTHLDAFEEAKWGELDLYVSRVVQKYANMFSHIKLVGSFGVSLQSGQGLDYLKTAVQDLARDITGLAFSLLPLMTSKTPTVPAVYRELENVLLTTSEKRKSAGQARS